MVKMNIGKIKAIADREFTYISRFNFVMISYLFFKETGFKWWFLIFIPVFIYWVYLDVKYIMPKEFEYLHEKSPFMRKLMQK